MKKTLLICLALLLSVAFVTSVFAKAPAKAKVLLSTGTVVSEDPVANTLIVKEKTGDVMFDIANAKLSGYKTIGDIKTGDNVTVKYNENEGKRIAVMITKAVVKAETKAK